MRANYVGKEHLAPRARIRHEQETDPKKLLEMAAIAVGIGMPVDGARLAEMTGLPLLAPGQSGAVRLAPVAAVDVSRLREDVKPPPALPPAERVAAIATPSLDPVPRIILEGRKR